MKHIVITIALLMLHGPAWADDYGDYRDTRTLNIPAAGLEQFKVDVGAIATLGKKKARNNSGAAMYWNKKRRNPSQRAKLGATRAIATHAISFGV